MIIKKVFLSSAMDERDEISIKNDRSRILDLFKKYNVEIVYAQNVHHDNLLLKKSRKEIAEDIVKRDISLLLQCNALFFDYSLENYSYIGCISEITYAKLFAIPVVVYCGNKSLSNRWWLVYHSDYITSNIDEAVEMLIEIINQ